MLSSFRSSARYLSLSRAVRPTRAFTRTFTSSPDSHDDFKPKKKTIPDDMNEVLKVIEDQVKKNPVILYMKGTPSKPQCGFSGQAVRILNAIGVPFSFVNILEYPAVREGVKLYSEWPTLPQLYVAGEFVGGCDIMTTMYNSGDLQKLFESHKLVKDE